ncbi:protein FAM214A [Penicillium digitatum]|uniref:Atos-like conserved domain-containing protein n=3 Tax=Penicillium digitatum TaxID=36651 RepID=K9FDE6_PEND2|nr:hypothetical protein PDIP_28180 [Penicillium digitatum Pd1]EKV06202.1 hypothetical protein PDIG_79800 [Penicillium digitatum PHI26]EKV18118.1 hypothetical protein PDIP_28180 [Penicillium digitatum Pd1]KAG0155008.1 hypothetical protein PDIDSM_581 [Penicillium digitatum]QQK47087.1 protein FAM214A [Penicillium digitatum]
MPLFQDQNRRRHFLWSPDHGNRQQPTTGSSQPQLNDLNHHEKATPDMATNSMDSTELSPPKSWANDREELIQRIKESSPWRLQRLSLERHNNDLLSSRISPEQSPTAAKKQEDHSLHQKHHTNATEQLGSPADIQRPRSALHSGDFREGATDPHGSHAPGSAFAGPSSVSPFAHLSSSPTTSWFEAPALPPGLQKTSALNDDDDVVNACTRAPEVGSFSSSYVLKAPTSPLVHQANNTDLDFSSRVDYVDVSEPLVRKNRRRTLPPETFRNLQFSLPSNQVPNLGSPSPPERQQDLFTNQQSLPRRPLSSAYSLQLAPSPGGQILPSRARRPSFVSDLSSNPHAPMVGSYEECILRGRMSMNPSKPLNFTAQIGVLGKGKCKSHLKCPPHVTVPFPVVFYSYPTSGSGRSISDDNPSPYVGQIDLENSLSKETHNTTRRRRRYPSPTGHCEDTSAPDAANDTPTCGAEPRRRREKKNHRSESPKCPPGGSYRIPQQGQLQIIIKNPHKTAVKLFLVPYNLGDMEPGTKTFIRQRSYSAGPIIDMPLSARKNLGTDRPEASLNPTEDPQEKPTLRYLIHLNICCPARGRFYLHSTIRVVFANRVPDGKEKLRNEIQNPEPRYSPYKPIRESSISSAASANARLGIEKTSHGRSTGEVAIPHLHPHVSPHSKFPSQDVLRPMDVPGGPENAPSSSKLSRHNEFTKDDGNYGCHPIGSEASESLLAKRLRGLDVHRPVSTVDERYPHKLGFYDRPSPTHHNRPR